MAATKLILGFFLCLLGTTVLATTTRSPLATTRSPRHGGPEFCNLQQLNSYQPTQRLDFEGGSIEYYWSQNEEPHQCLGTSPSRMTIQPNSLFLPSFQSFPRLLFIEQGEGIVGIQIPGCAETFDTGVQFQHQQQQQQQPRRMGEQGFDASADSHQKVHRFRQGDIIAIPAGAVHWAYNDANQEVVAVIVDDVNNPSNQLDLQAKISFLAGGISSEHIQGQQGQGRRQQQGQQGRQQQDRRRSQHQGRFQEDRLEKDNVFAGFDTELLAEAFNSDPQIVRALQESRNRGLIVRVQQPMQFVTPEEHQLEHMRQRRSGGPSNGMEETICSAKLMFNLDNQREADVFNRQAGKLNMVNEHKLPILSLLDLSAEKGHLQPNALISPHWNLNSHTIIYVLSGDAQVQVVSNNGEAVLDEQVSRGDIFPVPQFFATTARAGQNGFEWVAFKTNRSPLKSPLAGYTSVFRAMPLDVITNAYEVSPSQAQNLKTNRETESLLFSPQRQQY